MAETTNNNAPSEVKENKKKRFRNKPRAKKQQDNYVPNAPKEVLAVTIEELDLPEKIHTALVAGGVLTVGDIIKRRMTEMYKIKNIGKKDCFEIQKRLNKYNVTYREEEANVADTPNNHKSERGARENNKEGKSKSDKRNKREHTEPIVEEIDKDDLVKFYRKKKWGFKDYKGKEVIAPEYDEAFPFREDYACVEKDEKLGYIDKTGEIVIPFLYDSALSFSEGLASVTIGDYSGYIDKTGEIVFPLEYDSATSFMDGKAIIKKDGRWGFLTKDGNIRWK